MTVERTEEEALSLLLTVSMGGQEYQLPTLSLKASDAWLDQLGAAMAEVDVVEEGEDGTAMLQALLKASGNAMLRLVVAYDHTDVLGGMGAIQETMTKRELVAALEGMVTAEDPSGEAAARSVVEAFGEPSRMMERGVRMVTEPMLRLVQSPNGLSVSGDSTTAETSIPGGRESSSSSTGRTPKTASRRTPKSAAS